MWYLLLFFYILYIWKQKVREGKRSLTEITIFNVVAFRMTMHFMWEIVNNSNDNNIAQVICIISHLTCISSCFFMLCYANCNAIMVFQCGVYNLVIKKKSGYCYLIFFPVIISIHMLHCYCLSTTYKCNFIL